MPKLFFITLLSLLSAPALLASDFRLDKTLTVQNFVNEMVRDHGFDKNLLQEVFSKVKIHNSILKAISRPAESKPWYDYRPIFVTDRRIRGGIEFWDKHAELLKRASQTYGVPEEIIVAIIGVETRYGKHAGRYPVVDALATLAFAYPPRSKFFRKELVEFLLMTRDEKLDPNKPVGSYAGAMGMPQFMPSSFRMYAVDFDGDGKRDIWNNPADAIGSVGNYFKRHHWKPGQPIASAVQVSGNDYHELLGKSLKPAYSREEFTTRGIRISDDIPADIKGVLLELEGKDGPEYWIGWHNFYVISRYNHSALYSMATYQLSQEIKRRRK